MKQLIMHFVLGLVLALLSTQSHAQSNRSNLLDMIDFEKKIERAINELKTKPPQTPKKVLVFSVTKGYRHHSIPVGQLMLKLLGDKTGAFEAIVSNDLDELEAEKIKKYDAIVFLSTTGELFSPHSKRQKVELTPEEEQAWAEKAVRLKMNMMAHIKNGKGFIGIHSATDTFYDWPEYGDMIGAYFDGHPWTAKTEVTIKVAEGQENNPLVSYLGDDNLIFQEEICQCFVTA